MRVKNLFIFICIMTSFAVVNNSWAVSCGTGYIEQGRGCCNDRDYQNYCGSSGGSTILVGSNDNCDDKEYCECCAPGLPVGDCHPGQGWDGAICYSCPPGTYMDLPYPHDQACYNCPNNPDLNTAGQWVQGTSGWNSTNIYACEIGRHHVFRNDIGDYSYSDCANACRYGIGCR